MLLMMKSILLFALCFAPFDNGIEACNAAYLPYGVTAPTAAAMPRKPIRSSNIASIGYDAASYTLEVEFRSGSVYQYYSVPKSVYMGLMNASSHGTYLAHYVKGVYRYSEVN